MLLRKPRSYAEIYNDLDGEIVNLFRVARDFGPQLAMKVALTPFARREFDASYDSSEDPIEQARRTVVRAMMAVGSSGISDRFKSGFRSDVNRTGGISAHDWTRLPSNIEAVVERLRGVIIENWPWQRVIQKNDGRDALHFVDPPYPSATRTHRDGKGAYRHEFSDQDHVDLARTLHDCKGAAVVCSYPNEMYDMLYLGWTRVEKAVMVHNTNSSSKRTEVLWMRGCTVQPELFTREASS